jgi:hypothetical protein
MEVRTFNALLGFSFSDGVYDVTTADGSVGD